MNGLQQLDVMQASSDPRRSYLQPSSNVVHQPQQRRSISSNSDVPVIDLTDSGKEPNARQEYRNDRNNVILLQKPVNQHQHPSINNVPSPYNSHFNNKNLPSKSSSSSSNTHVSSSSKNVPHLPVVHISPVDPREDHIKKCLRNVAKTQLFLIRRNQQKIESIFDGIIKSNSEK